MKKIVSSIAIIICTITYSNAQQGNGCAIVFFYDNAGNQINREYFCGNLDNTGGRAMLVQQNNNVAKPQNIEVSKINAVYPNPTTGTFSMIFGSELKDATIQIIDLTGKIIQQRKITSTLKEIFDISSSPAGTYFLRVAFNGKLITQKIIKQ